MGWNEVGNKHIDRYIRDFITCEDSSEKEFLVRTIEEEFPTLQKAEIEEVMNECYGSLNGPRPTSLFLLCLKRKLNVY